MRVGLVGEVLLKALVFRYIGYILSSQPVINSIRYLGGISRISLRGENSNFLARAGVAARPGSWRCAGHPASRSCLFKIQSRDIF